MNNELIPSNNYQLYCDVLFQNLWMQQGFIGYKLKNFTLDFKICNVFRILFGGVYFDTFVYYYIMDYLYPENIGFDPSLQVIAHCVIVMKNKTWYYFTKVGILELSQQYSFPHPKVFNTRPIEKGIFLKPNYGLKGDDCRILKHNEKFDDPHGNFIFQEILENDDFLIMEDRPALHCLRIHTIKIKGEKAFCGNNQNLDDYAVTLKIGRKSSYISNMYPGTIICSISKDGVVQDVAYESLNAVISHDFNSKHYKSITELKNYKGKNITGRKIVEWEKLVETCLRIHNEALVDDIMIGWDVALTKNGYKIIEANNISAFIDSESFTKYALQHYPYLKKKWKLTK